ncbi:MAG: ABC transporter permease [Actinomycetota bacterium]|nr:ABC transporter permease [Actinomycetota bacterium]
MSQFLSYATPGLPYGCVFALLGMGLVLTYQTSGVFNLAFGAQAYASALVFYECVANGWPTWAAFLVAVVVGAPLLGLVMDRGLYRFVRTKPVLVKLVAALGMLIAIPAVFQFAFPGGNRYNPPSLWLSPSIVYFHLAGDPINGSELSTVILTAAVALGLSLMFHFTQAGLRMRAIAESPGMVELAGINADRVGMASWMLSSFLAGLAGVMLAPVFGDLQPLNFTVLLVAAVAAAAAGSLRSLPYTFLGGIVLGLLEELLGGYLPSGHVLSSGLRPGLPFVVLLGLLLFLPGLRRRWTRSDDPLAVVRPPPAPLASATRSPSLRRTSRLGTTVFCLAFVASCLTWVSPNWVFNFSQALALAIVFLSLVLLTGMSGQISLCQAAFAGVGAFTAGQLAVHFNVSILVGMLIAGVAAGAVGAVVALPALRLGGLALALATLAFGLLADNIGFQYGWSGNGESGISIPRPVLGPVNFAGDRAFFCLTVVVLGLCIGVVMAIRRGTTGRQLAALRGSELAAASIGINPRRAKILVFTLSAAIAGVGGAVYGSLETSVSASDFNTLLSLVFVVVVATVGVYTVEGAVEAGLAYVVLSTLLTSPGLPAAWANILELVFGAGAIAYVLHPEGAVEYVKRLVVEHLARHGTEIEVLA